MNKLLGVLQYLQGLAKLGIVVSTRGLRVSLAMSENTKLLQAMNYVHHLALPDILQRALHRHLQRPAVCVLTGTYSLLTM
jgi:hypothetical protein